MDGCSLYGHIRQDIKTSFSSLQEIIDDKLLDLQALRKSVCEREKDRERERGEEGSAGRN